MKLCTLALIASAVFGGIAQAQLVSLDFDAAVGSPALASQFNTGRYSFHNAVFLPKLDRFGDPIPGTEHWQIDVAADLSTPITIENPSLEEWGRGHAPSEPFALQAVFGPVLIQFDQAYRLSQFSVFLDHDAFGTDGVNIEFLSGTTIEHQIGLDQTVPGFRATLDFAENITGIVLPSGAFYDDLSFRMTAVPEPSTWAAGCALAVIAATVVIRRRRAV